LDQAKLQMKAVATVAENFFGEIWNWGERENASQVPETFAMVDGRMVDTEVADVLGVKPNTLTKDALIAAYHNPNVPLGLRIRCMVAVAQYMHSKLSVVASPDSPATSGQANHCTAPALPPSGLIWDCLL
jgi:hypothetical protein